MCGIAGFTNFHYSLSNGEDVIVNMCNQIAHRGPDEWGFKNFSEAFLGHRRLSIVGLQDGKQPLSYADSHISFNGEIYNFRSLKKELLEEGYQFLTNTDTEVILALYNKYGLDMFKQMNGMFAMAIWDDKKKRMILARDRMGEKPLFYYLKNGDLIFSSELKSLIRHPKFTKKLNMSALNKFLTYEYVPSPHCIFEDAYKLEAGEFLVIDENGVKKDFYWQHPNLEFEGESIGSESEAIDELEQILLSSVDLRLQADVPVGVFLSGGLDSSLISALAVKQNRSPNKIKSFSLYFHEKTYDESKYVEKIVDKIGTEHYAEYFNSKDMLNIFPKLGSMMDEPMADPSIVPTYLVSKLAATQVKTVLSGDGADELFAGYPTYLANKLVSLYNIIPYEIRKFITTFLRSAEGSLIPVSNNNISLDFKLKQFLRGAGVASEIRFFRWMGGFIDREKRAVFSADANESVMGELSYDDLNRLLSRTNMHSELQRLLYLSQKVYLADDILAKVDRSSMMNSLEVRTPFLDHRLVEYATALPERFKLHGFESKYILKKVAERYIPHENIYRPKKGFGIPITEWLRTDLKDPMLDLLSTDRLKRQGLFDDQNVHSLIDEHMAGKTNNRKLLWPLICFQLWMDEFEMS